MRSAGWLFAMPPDKAAEVAAKRGQIVSALMKHIRLRREVDACYWFLLLFRGGMDRPYLGRRCYGSSAEDGMSIPAMETGAELVTRPATTELPYLQAVIASSRAPKWYEAPYRQYTLDRLAVFDGGRPWRRETDAAVLRWGEAGLAQHDFVKLFRADLELWYRKKNLPLERKLGRANRATCRRSSGWRPACWRTCGSTPPATRLCPGRWAGSCSTARSPASPSRST